MRRAGRRSLVFPLVVGTAVPVLGGWCCFAGAVFWWSNGPDSGNSPQEMFEHVIRRPIPDGVSDLQGCGDTWQGYSLYLRFRATDEVIASLLADGYKPAEWDHIRKHFELPGWMYGRRFAPAWDPAGLGGKECYVAKASNGWTGMGTHYLVIDRRTGTVYFYGVGA